jgi:[ribosomal protein S5]-alanine N-acetyltransferase
MRIDLDGFCIRSYAATDADDIVRHGNNEKVSAHMTHRFPCPYTHDDARQWLEIVLNQQRESLFALAIGDELMGSVGLHLGEGVYACMAEIGYWVAEPYWGRGIATAAVEAITPWGFAAFPDLSRLQAHVFASNPASARVLQGAGYELEATLRRSVVKRGRLLDQWLYVKLR